MDKKEAPQKEPSASSFLGIREAIGVAVAAMVASITTWFAIGRRMGSNFEEMGKFDLAHKVNGEITGAAGIIQNQMLKKIADLNNDSARHGKEFASRMGAIYREHEQEVSDYWTSRGVANTLDKIKSLKPHQRLEVLFGTVTVFSVAVGAIIGLAKSEEIAHLFRKHKKKSEEESQMGRS